MKKEKSYNLMGIIVGIIIIIAGILIMFTPADSYTTRSVKSYTFGADYYTEQYAATEAVVGNTAVTANNLRELGAKLAQYVGLAFVFSGILVCIEYGKKHARCVLKIAEEKSKNVEYQVIESTDAIAPSEE